MTDESLIRRLDAGLIVSCQPVGGGPMDLPEVVSAFSQAALAGGAVGLRIEGVENLRAVRADVEAPIIGLIKRKTENCDIYITPDFSDIDLLVEAGVDIIAVDATHRPRPRPFADMVARVKAQGKLVMADCSCIEDGRSAIEAGADILGTTLSGYVCPPPPTEPDFSLISDFCRLGFTIAEGRITSPEKAEKAMRMGANAVVVGSAITRTEWVTGWYQSAVREGARDQKGKTP